MELEKEATLGRLLLFVMAVTGGVTVASIYYIQPLLADVASTYHINATSVGVVAMLTQLGYAAGMILITPLSDIIEKKRLITIVLCCSVFALLLMFIAPNFIVVEIASFVVGITSVTPQLITPFAAFLAKPNERGKSIGTVAAGIFLGILLSRVFSGFIGSTFFWKDVYFIATIITIILIIMLRKLLPVSRPITKLKYIELIKSFPGIIKTHPLILEASVEGAIIFAGFNAFWASLVFLLSSNVYHMGAKEAGLFGFVGIVGATASSVAGRGADKRSPKFIIGIGIAFVTASFVVFLLLGNHIWGLIIGVILLDLGVQTCFVTNQTRINSISESKRNRINAIYMFTYFVGGSMGSVIGVSCFEHFGWIGVCMFGIGTQLICIIIHAMTPNEPIIEI